MTFATLFSICLTMSTGALRQAATQESMTVTTLRPVKGFKILVEDLNPELSGVITREQISDAIELELRSRSIPIYYQSNADETNPVVTLYIQISGIKNGPSDFSFYTIREEVLGYGKYGNTSTRGEYRYWLNSGFGQTFSRSFRDEILKMTTNLVKSLELAWLQSRDVEPETTKSNSATHSGVTKL